MLKWEDHHFRFARHYFYLGLFAFEMFSQLLAFECQFLFSFKRNMWYKKIENEIFWLFSWSIQYTNTFLRFYNDDSQVLLCFLKCFELVIVCKLVKGKQNIFDCL